LLPLSTYSTKQLLLYHVSYLFIYAEESTGLVGAQPMGMTFGSENVHSAGYNNMMPLPPPLAGSNSKMFVADPLQLSIGTHAPAANHMPGSSSVAFSRYTGSDINLNLPPPGKKKMAAAIPNNASPNLKTKKPYELPLCKWSTVQLYICKHSLNFHRSSHAW
jgi:hypothetical protein